MNTKILTTAALAMIGACGSVFAQNIWEDFESADVGNNYTTVISSTTTPDSFAVFGYDYSALLGWDNNVIGGGDANQTAFKGLQLTANDGGGGAGGTFDGVNVFSNVLLGVGPRTIRFDMYMRWLEFTASTEYAFWGLNHPGTSGTWNSISLPAVDGYWCSLSADGGTSRDYRIYKAGTEDNVAANYAAGSQNNLDTDYWLIFPDLDGAGGFSIDGTPGNRWVQCQLSFDPITGTRSWYMKQASAANWSLIYSQVDISPFQDNGRFQFGLADPFASQSFPESMTIIDNVEVVTSPTAVLARRFTIGPGEFFGGSIQSLANSDDDPVFILNSENDPNATIVVSGTSPVSSAVSYGGTVETSATRSDLSQFIDVFNFAANGWNNLNVATSSGSDVVFTWANTTNPNDYISQTTREVRGRVRWFPNEDLIAEDGWSERVDQFIWDVTP